MRRRSRCSAGGLLPPGPAGADRWPPSPGRLRPLKMTMAMRSPLASSGGLRLSGRALLRSVLAAAAPCPHEAKALLRGAQVAVADTGSDRWAALVAAAFADRSALEAAASALADDYRIEMLARRTERRDKWHAFVCSDVLKGGRRTLRWVRQPALQEPAPLSRGRRACPGAPRPNWRWLRLRGTVSGPLWTSPCLPSSSCGIASVSSLLSPRRLPSPMMRWRLGSGLCRWARPRPRCLGG